MVIMKNQSKSFFLFSVFGVLVFALGLQRAFLLFQGDRIDGVVIKQHRSFDTQYSIEIKLQELNDTRTITEEFPLTSP